MKVIFSTRSFTYPLGGFEEHIYQITRRLIKQGIDVEIYTTTLFSKNEEYHEETVDGVKVRRYPITGRFFGYCYSKKLEKALSEANCDVIHAQGWGYHAVNAAYKVAKKHEIPMVLTPHGLFHPGRYGIIKVFYNTFLSKRILRDAHLIALTNHQADSFTKMKANKVTVIPNGIELETFINLPKTFLRKELGLEGKKIILGVGRIAWYKGFQDVIKALQIIIKQHPNVFFLLVGEDWGAKEKLKNLAEKMEIEKHVVFSGFSSREKVLAAYHEADLYVSSSSFEGFGVTILEALAAGKPTISTKTGVALDLQNIVSLYDYGDFRKLSELICKILEDEAFSKIKSVEGKSAASGFSWDNIVEKLISLYGTLIKG